MFLSIFLIIIGLAALILGADWMINGAAGLAKRFKVSDLAIGLTVVAFGTSAPELVVNAIASVDGYSEIVLGNIIGSNNFNLFIILGLAGLIYPIQVQSSTAWKEIPLSLVVAAFFFFMANDYFIGGKDELSRVDGLILLVGFILFLVYVFTQLKSEPSETIEEAVPKIGKLIFLIAIGLAGLIIGGKLVVDHAVSVATELGVSQKVIGMTIIAAGTSLPELVTSIVAALKKKSDIAIGNVIGSNIFNILLILSVSTLIRPIEYIHAFNTDLYILMGGTVFLLIAMFTGVRKKLDRWESGLLLFFYIGYIVYMVVKG